MKSHKFPTGISSTCFNISFNSFAYTESALWVWHAAPVYPV